MSPLKRHVPKAFFAGDFNEDGRSDAVVGDSSGFDVMLLNDFPPYATAVNAASYSANRTMSPNSISAVFGASLAAQTLSTGSTLGTELAGTTVNVIDSNGTVWAADLFFVSAGQVNFALPAGIAIGPAEVQVTSGGGGLSAGPITIATIAPGIFTLNGSLAAALTVTADSQGNLTYQDAYQYDSSTGTYVAASIELSANPNGTYLILYGTGLEGASLSQVSVSFGSTVTAPAFIGPTGFLGEDQVNVLIPSSLVGAGDVEVTLSAAGIAANPVHVTVNEIPAGLWKR